MLTALLVAANLAAFLIELDQGRGGALDAFVRRWGLVPADMLGSLQSSEGPAVLVTLFTYGLQKLHSIFLHIKVISMR